MFPLEIQPEIPDFRFCPLLKCSPEHWKNYYLLQAVRDEMELYERTWTFESAIKLKHCLYMFLYYDIQYP